MASRRFGKGWALACALLVGLAVAAAGCGVKGGPRPPKEPIIKGL
ncbi:MAG: hypothetical protein V3V56_00660 [bacterium]